VELLTWVHIEGSTAVGAVKATTNFALLTELIGSTGNAIKATTDGALLVSGISVTIANVIIDPSTAIAVGTVGLTSNAAQLAAQACRRLQIQSDPDNTVDVFIGGAVSQPLQMQPGDNDWFYVANKNLLYAKCATSTATLNWFAETS